jgi:alanine dehydrogenase
MNIGIPKEIKPFEGRVGLIPEACATLIAAGHSIFIERNAGLLSGFSNEEYLRIGSYICESTEELYTNSTLIVKVKEPLKSELKYLTEEHILFCFLHLAANKALANQLANIGLTAIAFESVRENNILPLLKPMSEIAGRLSVQIGTTLLHLQNGGSGLMLGGMPNNAVDKGRVLVLGAGAAGSQAALVANRIGANVSVFDRSAAALSAIKHLNKTVDVISDVDECLTLLPTIDLLIGALLIPGKKTPRFITRSHLRGMKSGSVVVDISVDQGGCVETTRPTSYDNPTFVEEGVIHFCVANMPGAVPQTSSQALSELLPEYIQRLSSRDWYQNDAVMRDAVNIKDNKVLIDI